MEVDADGRAPPGQVTTLAEMTSHRVPPAAHLFQLRRLLTDH